MSRPTACGIALLEPLTIFGLIMAYIWQLRYSYRGFWLGILAMVILSIAQALQRRSSMFRIPKRSMDVKETFLRILCAEIGERGGIR